MEMSGAPDSQIKDEAGDPAVTRTSGPVPASSCCPSSLQPPCALAPRACQASCQRYFPDGSSACFACRSPRLPAGWCGPLPLQAAGEGFHGYVGLGSPAYRWQSIPGKVPQEPTAPQQDPGHFLGPHSGQRDVEGCDGRIPDPQSLQGRTAVRDALGKHPTEMLQRGVSRAVDNSGFLLQLDAV